MADQAPPTISVSEPSPAKVHRECFVTIGATASFRVLLDEALSKPFVRKLIDLRYTKLSIQCGFDLQYVESKLREAQREDVMYKGLHYKLFDFNKKGLGDDMRGCKGVYHKNGRDGVIVCHAGR